MSGLPLLLLLVACGGDSENPPSPSRDSLDTGRTTPCDPLEKPDPFSAGHVKD